MKQKELISSLFESGLTEKEAAVYANLLECGQSSIARLLKILPYKRGDLYNILYSLRDQDLIIQEDVAGKIHFSPAPPHRLRDLVDNKRATAISQAAQLEQMLPSLVSLFTLTQKKPSVSVYEGLDGLQKVYNQMNSSGTKEYLLMRSIHDNNESDLKEIVKKQREAQKQLGIQVRALAPSKKNPKPYLEELDRENLVTRHVIQREFFMLDAQILIWENSVALISLKDSIISTVIDNDCISQTFKTIFEYMWQASSENSL